MRETRTADGPLQTLLSDLTPCRAPAEPRATATRTRSASQTGPASTPVSPRPVPLPARRQRATHPPGVHLPSSSGSPQPERISTPTCPATGSSKSGSRLLHGPRLRTRADGALLVSFPPRCVAAADERFRLTDVTERGDGTGRVAYLRG
jgi:hypothetical protein